MMRSTIVVAALVVGSAFLAGCASNSTSEGVSAFDASLRISKGMSYDEALTVFSGLEMRRTFRDDATALQVCSGGFPKWRDEYVTVWLYDNRVSGLTQWDKPADFTCQSGFREVDWGQAPADVKINLNID